MPPVLPFLVAGGVAAFLLLLTTREASAAFATRGTASQREIELSRRAGVPVAVMRAIGQKESSDAPPPPEGWPAGKGVGQLHRWGGPKVFRFEPHLYNRKVSSSKHMPDTPGLGPESEVRESALLEAMTRDARAAVESASWGRYQVLGSHFLRHMYNNDPHKFLNEWRNADWEKVEDLSDEFFVFWWKAKPKATRWANLPMDSIVDTTWDARGWRRFHHPKPPPPRRAVDLISRRYNGSYRYANDRIKPNGKLSIGLMNAYNSQVGKGAPIALV